VDALQRPCSLQRVRRQKGRAHRGAKPLNALAALGTAAHHAFERRAGVGVFLEPWLGRRRTNLLWSIAIPVWIATALGGRERDQPLLAFNTGAAIAGPVVHFTDWPSSLRLGVFPWLDEAEGLPPEKLTAYNTLLWSWLASGVGSISSSPSPASRPHRSCSRRPGTTSGGRACRPSGIPPTGARGSLRRTLLLSMRLPQ
jgi:hypothetical protein